LTQRLRSAFDAIHLNTQAIAEVIAMAGAGRQELASLLGCLSFNAPLLAARNEHGCVEQLRRGFLQPTYPAIQ